MDRSNVAYDLKPSPEDVATNDSAVPSADKDSSTAPGDLLASASPLKTDLDNTSESKNAQPQQSAIAADAPPSAMVQIMALSHREDAETMVAALKRRGFEVAVHEGTRDSLLHLQVGPFASKVDAVAMQQRLLDEGYNATVK